MCKVAAPGIPYRVETSLREGNRIMLKLGESVLEYNKDHGVAKNMPMGMKGVCFVLRVAEGGLKS